jgi:hypothetical protein
MLVTGLLALTGCKGSRDSQIRELEQAITSWEATQRLTQQLRRTGAIPSVYAERAMQIAAQELERARQKLERLSSTSGSL